MSNFYINNNGHHSCFNCYYWQRCNDKHGQCVNCENSYDYTYYLSRCNGWREGNIEQETKHYSH